MKTALAFVVMVLLAFTCTYGGTRKVPDGIEFSYTDPSAFSVSVAGNFNNWDSQANAMAKDAEGTWRAVIALSPGTYEYKFVVNGGDWMADPDNPKVVGDYGNSEITITEEGEPVITGVAAIISNTPVHSRVMITGWFRATYGARKNVLADTRYRGVRPMHEAYVSINPTIGSDVRGSATMRLDTGVGDIREITTDLYAAWLKYKGPGFGVTAYHNEEILRFDNPMKSVGYADLPGSIERDDIKYGRGTQGIFGDLSFGNLETVAFLSNTQDGDIYNSPHRFSCDSWGVACDTVLRYDNIGTDNIGVRAKYELLGARWGFTYLTARNGWWVGFDEQDESEALKAYRKATGDTVSNWFEMGTQDWSAGADVSYRATDGFSLYGEYAWGAYDAGWDAGNRVRKQGDVFVDGRIDVPIGDTDSRRYRIGCDVTSGAHTLKLAYEGAELDGMEPDEVYVTYHGLPFEDPDTPLMQFFGPSLHDRTTYENTYVNVMNIEPFIIYEHHELPEHKASVGEVYYSTKAWGLDIGLELDIGKSEWKYKKGALDDADLSPLRIVPSLGGSLLGERLTYTLLYEGTRDNLHPRMPSAFDRDEFHVKGDLDIGHDWSLYYNVRWAGYDWSEGGAGKSKSFVNPHFAFVWSPIDLVELRFGWGVNPIFYRDTPVEGREIGRERWLTSRMWLDPETSLVDAEYDLDNLRMLTLMGVIAF